MFTKDSNGALQYISGNQVYSLLEGIDNKGYTSDIVFIYREPISEINGEEYGDFENSDVVGWFYGAFRVHNGNLPKEMLNYIEDKIKEYEKNILGSKGE